eukprot:6181086-Pleurochrysis_carterae.AAC.2
MAELNRAEPPLRAGLLIFTHLTLAAPSLCRPRQRPKLLRKLQRQSREGVNSPQPIRASSLLASDRSIRSLRALNAIARNECEALMSCRTQHARRARAVPITQLRPPDSSSYRVVGEHIKQ